MLGRTPIGELRAENAGEKVILHGWAHNIRDKKTIFLVLRDRYGLFRWFLMRTVLRI